MPELSDEALRALMMPTPPAGWNPSQQTVPWADDPAGAAQAARLAAARRMSGAVAPPGGRQDSGVADTLMNMVIPGKHALGPLSEGNYGEAAADFAMSALPYTKAPGMIMNAARTAAVPALAGGAALMGLGGGSELGASNVHMTPAQKRALELENAKADAQAKREMEMQKARGASDVELENIRETQRMARERANQDAIGAAAEERRKQDAQRPFAEAHPYIAGGAPIAAMLAGAAIPAKFNYNAAKNANSVIGDWDKTLAETRAAIANKDLPNARLGASQLRGFQKNWGDVMDRAGKGMYGNEPGFGGAMGRLGGMALTAGPTVEASLFPSEYDYMFQDHKSPAYDAAKEMLFKDPQELASRVGLNLLNGMGAAAMGNKIPFRIGEAPMAQSQGIENYVKNLRAPGAAAKTKGAAGAAPGPVTPADNPNIRAAAKKAGKAAQGTP
jgi:hypothetical protein